MSLPPAKAMRVPWGRCARVSRSLRGADEVAGVDGSRGQCAGAADVRAAARAPGLPGLDAVALGGEITHLLEGVPPVAEVVRPFGQGLQFMGGDFRAVLCAFEVAHLRHDLVDGAVDALGLRMERVHEAPEQALALVGELRSIRCDGLCEDTHGLLDAAQGFVFVPDNPGVCLAPFRGSAEQCEVLADGCCR